ncbi:Na+/H+ antiporter NhaA [Tomitella biformata]|uniref:Na+/H+ antiporter NhaA n=1 Tax=Tomitella biformata TaxID=630403 RepID=UPI000463A80A|nr:Na+/H+ antiporter NhaA [Tomitella biformata]
MTDLPKPTAFGRYLRTETAGGLFLLAAAALALLCANTPLYDAYLNLRDFNLGPASLNLDLTLGTWAQDALLAVFFFVAGIELKRELVLGELADRRKAALPIIAAFGGVMIPAVIALSIGWGTPGIDQAWAIPVATDIAFALGVLSLTAKRIPASARVFLLSLAVVDDLVAIAIIALVFTATIAMAWLAGAIALLVVYALAQRRRITTPLLYVPLAILAWVCMYQSGIHATVAGVALGLLTRVVHDPGEAESPASRLAHRIQPWSAGLCVPLFAFFAAGVHVNGALLQNITTDRIAIGIIVGLVVGKTIGIFGSAWLAIKFGLATRPAGLQNADMFALAVLGGIGFTVSLLVVELSLTGIDGGEAVETAKAAVLIASVIAALAGSFLISRRGKHYQRVAAQPPNS